MEPPNKRLDITMEGVLRLIEGMMVYALDKASISTKFRNKKKTKKVVSQKRREVIETKEWVGSENWHIWLNIYCQETGVNEKRIRNNFKKAIKNSLNYLTRTSRYHKWKTKNKKRRKLRQTAQTS